MSIPASISGLAGSWSGVSRLWMMPGEAERECESLLRASTAAQGQFAVFQYTWTFEGAPQDGLLLVGYEASAPGVSAVWVDSFHMADKIMLCRLTGGEPGEWVVKGAYAAPPGPDWGWQIAIRPQPDGKFKLVMHNITPQGEAFLAVEAEYARIE